MSNSSALESKLRGGIDLGPRAIKYLVSLRENLSHFCSGFVIRENFIVTTGQCIVKIEKRKKPDFSQYQAVVDGTCYAIKRVNYHLYFNSRKAMRRKHYDVGLILVNQQDLYKINLAFQNPRFFINYSYLIYSVLISKILKYAGINILDITN